MKKIVKNKRLIIFCIVVLTLMSNGTGQVAICNDYLRTKDWRLIY